MKIISRWIVTMVLFAGVLYLMGLFLLPVANSIDLELKTWLHDFTQNHLKAVAFFNFVSVFALVIVESFPGIVFVLLSIGAFFLCFILVDKIFTIIGLTNDDKAR